MRLDSAWIDRFAALRAGQHRSKIVPATNVAVKKRRPFLPRKVLIAPMHEPKQNGVKAKASLGQAILIAHRRLLIGHFRENATLDKVRKPFGQYAPRYPKPRLEIVEATNAQKRFPQHKQRPSIADNGERARQRTIFLLKVMPSHRSALCH
jgi:hypothetical protein